MGCESKSKYVEFIIENSDYINDIMESPMEEQGTLVGRGTVSYYDSDDMVTPEYDHSIVFEWEAGTGEKHILVGEEHDLVFDEIFDSIKICDLMLLEEGEETDLSGYESLSVEEMIRASKHTRFAGLEPEQFKELMSRLVGLKEDSLYRREMNGDSEVYPKVNGMIPYLEAREIIREYVIGANTASDV